MKYTVATIIALLALAIPAGAQELRGVQLEFLVANSAGREQTLVLGTYEGTSNGLDMHLGEAELPPAPPQEIFDARVASTPGGSQLGTGSFKDFRAPSGSGNTFSMTYTIAYQAGLNQNGVTLSWQEELPGRITKLTVDGEDMAGKSSVQSQFATGQFTIVLSFDLSPLGFLVNPNPINFNVNNRDVPPTQAVRISTQGDTRASWSLESSVDWITVEPSTGEGSGDVQVSVNTRLLPAGTYNGLLKVRSPLYPTRLDVPVNMTMVVGVERAPLPGEMWIGQNYPNPFNPTSVVDLDLGTLRAGAVPSLTVQDVLGRDVLDLSGDIARVEGRQSIHIDASALPGGTYTYTLRYGNTVRTRSMIVLK